MFLSSRKSFHLNPLHRVQEAVGSVSQRKNAGLLRKLGERALEHSLLLDYLALAFKERRLQFSAPRLTSRSRTRFHSAPRPNGARHLNLCTLPNALMSQLVYLIACLTALVRNDAHLFTYCGSTTRGGVSQEMFLISFETESTRKDQCETSLVAELLTVS